MRAAFEVESNGRESQIVYTPMNKVIHTTRRHSLGRLEVTQEQLVALMNSAHQQGYNHRQLHEAGLLLEPVYE